MTGTHRAADSLLLRRWKGPLAVGAFLLTLLIVGAALTREWRTAPAAISPLHMGRRGWPWLALVGGTVALIALLAPVRRGRVLLGLVLAGITAFLGLACLRMQALGAFAVLAWLLVLAAGLGHAALRRLFDFPQARSASEDDSGPRSNCGLSTLERCLLAVAPGLGLLSVVGMGLALCWRLNGWAVAGTLGLLTLLALPALRDLARRMAAVWPRWGTADLRLPALMLAMMAFSTLAFSAWAPTYGPFCFYPGG